jgi:hypothetical protein
MIIGFQVLLSISTFSSFVFNINLHHYIKDGVVPGQLRKPTASAYKGVYWYKSRGQWTARCHGKSLGQHATEEAAAQAYNMEARRIGRVDVNVIPPAGDTDDAALALISLAALARTHASAGSKRAGAPTTPASAQKKKMRLDGGVAVGGAASTSAGPAAGGWGGRLVVAAQEQH